MNNILEKAKTPKKIEEELAERVRFCRKRQGLSREKLSQKSGVSFGSLKRFETTGDISLISLVKIAIALGYEEDFEQLFATTKYKSIQEIIDEQN